MRPLVLSIPSLCPMMRQHNNFLSLGQYETWCILVCLCHGRHSTRAVTLPMASYDPSLPATTFCFGMYLILICFAIWTCVMSLSGGNASCHSYPFWGLLKLRFFVFMSWETQPRAACMPRGQHATLTACNDICWSILCPTQLFSHFILFRRIHCYDTGRSFPPSHDRQVEKSILTKRLFNGDGPLSGGNASCHSHPRGDCSDCFMHIRRLSPMGIRTHADWPCHPSEAGVVHRKSFTVCLPCPR